MRDPSLTTLEAVEGYRPAVKGEPPMARVSINMLADMHEAMDIEEEIARRAEQAAKKRKS
jgi:hypothetical protein